MCATCKTSRAMQHNKENRPTHLFTLPKNKFPDRPSTQANQPANKQATKQAAMSAGMSTYMIKRYKGNKTARHMHIHSETRPRRPLETYLHAYVPGNMDNRFCSAIHPSKQLVIQSKRQTNKPDSTEQCTNITSQPRVRRLLWPFLVLLLTTSL